MHLTSPPNTLGAEVCLAAAATLLRNVANYDPQSMISCSRYGQPFRNSDPHIGFKVNQIVKNAGFTVSLANPVGLYIQEPEWGPYKTPDGTPAKDFLTVARGNGPNQIWLADQHDDLIYYQIKMDKDEFDSIVANGVYNAVVQYETACTGMNPTPGGDYQVTLPAGCNSGSCPNHGRPRMGAIEIKAAWRILTKPSQYKRYLTTQAVLVNKSGVCTRATMGLVGLHIVHNTVSQPQFIWATFEQVDNVPPPRPRS